MFQAYVAVGFKKHCNLVNANPYVTLIDNGSIYLQEINKEEANGIVYYLLDELRPEEVYLFRNSITVIGVDDIIKKKRSKSR